jgi:hypothetical protein
MKIKTTELVGEALDWAVALIEHPDWREQGYLESFYDLQFDDGYLFSPSTDWSQGGPLIQSGKLIISPDPSLGWTARSYMDSRVFSGTTPLIAAMRCYVANHYGDEVEMPIEEAA